MASGGRLGEQYSLCSVPDGNRCYTLAGHSNRANVAAFSPDGKIIASVSSDANVKLWKLADFTAAKPPPLQKQTLLDTFISPTGSVLATTTPDISAKPAHKATLRLWDTATWKEIPQRIGSTSDICDHTNRVALADDKHTIAIARQGSSKVGIGNILPDGTVSPISDIQIHKDAAGITFSPDSYWLAIPDGKNTLYVWHRTINVHVPIFGSSDPKVILNKHIRFSLDNRFLVFKWEAPGKNYVRLWNLKHQRVEKDLTGLRNDLMQSAFSSDSRYLAVSDWDGAIIVWDVTTFQEVKRFRAYQSYATALAFSPDGNTLATGHQNDDIKLWNTATLREVAHFPGHKGHRVWWFVFTLDGTQFLSATDEGIRMWKAATPAEIEAREQKEGRIPLPNSFSSSHRETCLSAPDWF